MISWLLIIIMLGALSPIGLLIKNAIVSIEEIDQQIIAEGKEPYQAIQDSGAGRGCGRWCWRRQRAFRG